MSVNSEGIQPSLDLYNKVKGAFISKGTTLTAWCRKNDLKVPNVRSALIGSWNGKAAKKLRTRIVASAGIEVDEQVVH
ncbi:MAG: hypothetical protein OQJ95_01870 [Kangiella sp.]|nr:hypothetical protein [Kangiella sp.]MCW9029224.1 hypothetical protein [Kangiella sp.]